jgi:AcrR family transcriptional regulator
MARVPFAHLEARRLSICEAAQRVFARKGIQSATMSDIALEAGVSAGLIYRYYPNKDALAVACLRDGADQALAEWHQAAESGASPAAVFDQLAHSSFDELSEADAPNLTRLMLENFLAASRDPRAPIHNAIMAQHVKVETGLREVLELMHRSGDLPASIDTRLLAQALLAFYHGARIAKLMDPDADILGQMEQVRTLISLAAKNANVRVPLSA